MVLGSDSGLTHEELLIFVSDSSAEAERLTAALRARGYELVEVPLSMLVGRVAVQRPSLILCDVDAEGALETTHRLRDIPGGAGVDIIFLGEPGRTLDDMADAVFHEGSGFFVRPVDVYALLRKVEALIGPPMSAPVAQALVSAQRSAPPVKIASSQPPGQTSGSAPSTRTPSSAAAARRVPATRTTPAKPTASSHTGQPTTAEPTRCPDLAESATWAWTGDRAPAAHFAQSAPVASVVVGGARAGIVTTRGFGAARVCR